MSVSRSTSSNPLSATPENEKDQEKSSAISERNGDKQDTGKEQKKTSTPGERTRKKLAELSPPRKLDKPLMRGKLGTRERSVSSPLIIRPVANPDDATPQPAKTPDAKLLAANRKSKEEDAATLPKSSGASSPSMAHGNTRLPSSTPKLQTKKPKPARQSLSPEQQLTKDLAELMDKQLLRKSGRADDEIAVNQMATSLQRFSGKSPDATVRIDELMLKMFSAEMKTSDAWEIARQTTVKIKTAYFFGRDETSVVEEKKDKEAADMLQFLVASFAGAFFNVSGDEKNRLPEKLRLFIQAVDHRQIRALLSTGAGIRLSHEKFMQARKEWLAKTLLDTFLIPLVLKEFFPARGTMESDKTAAHLIQALHAALSVSATDLLAESLKSPPEDIAQLLMQRLKHQSRLRSGQHGINFPGGPSSLPKTLSPEVKRREQLKALLDKAIKRLAPHTLSDDMLKLIRSVNREWADSDERLDEDVVLREWLDLARKVDAKAAVVKEFQAWMAERDEQITLDREFVVIDMVAKLAQIESIGGPLPSERATRLSGDLPIAETTPVVSPANSPSSSSSSTQRRVARSPASPSNRPVQHKRSKTADVSVPVEKSLSAELTTKQRAELIKIYPDLLLDRVKDAAMIKAPEGKKWRPNPVKGIWETGRNKFSIAAESIPLALRVKLFPASRLANENRTISHAELWKLLTMGALKASPLGTSIAADRAEALQLAGKSLSVAELNLEKDHIEEKKILNQKFKPKTDALVARVFDQGLAEAGIPAEIIESCKVFDRKLMQWVGEALLVQKPSITSEEIDGLRSNLVFDLLITRLLYPMVMPENNVEDSVNETNYSSAFQRSIKAMWDEQLFNDFKALQTPDAMNGASTASVGSAIQTPVAKPSSNADSPENS